MEQAVALLRPLLKDLLVSNPPATFDERVRTVNRIKQLLDGAGLAIRHPVTGVPCLLEMHLGNLRAVRGSIRVRPCGGGSQLTLNVTHELDLVPYNRRGDRRSRGGGGRE